MKQLLSYKTCYRLILVCILLSLTACQTRPWTKLTLATNSLESSIIYGIKQGPPNNRGGRYYDVNTIETQQGKVVSIDRTSTAVNTGGIHLTLDIGDEQLPVHVGPAWYLEDQSLQITVDDEIEVTGSRVIIDNNPALIAAEIRIDDTVVVLRDRNGIPQWRHHGPGRRHLQRHLQLEKTK